MQIGNGQYVPKNCRHFRFAPSLDPYYDSAAIVVSHGGLGIVTEALEKGKKLISAENDACHGAHQRELLSTLAEEGYLIWCRDLNDLPELLERAREHEFKRYVPPECQIPAAITAYLRTLTGDSSHVGTTMDESNTRLQTRVAIKNRCGDQ